MTSGMRITTLDLLADLEALRQISGFSKREVCQEIGVSRMTYHNWLIGEHVPNSIYEPELARTIQWMQGMVERREKKEKADEGRSGSVSVRVRNEVQEEE